MTSTSPFAAAIPAPLPIDGLTPEVLRILREGSAVVIVAPPGAGKTTRIPPALAAGLGSEGMVLMLEPRRIAARAAARRIAEESGHTLGEEVGFQIRFERRWGARTKILVVTEGILVQMLQADPFLEKVGVLVFDEIHERSLHTDLALAMARRVQREVRSDLKIVAMSATVDPGPISTFLGGCPVVESAGRLFPVEVGYSGGAGGAAAGGDRPLPARVAAGVRGLLDETPGDLLVFLPGLGEIQRCAEALEPLAAQRDLDLSSLYGDLPSERQDAALRRGERRKVVLATNVAETSVTVEGVTAVLDSGLVRRLRFDPATGLDRLELGRVSRASADQRAGRAGRQAPGVCLRLWPRHEHPTLAEREEPEILRVDLCGPALQLMAWGETDLLRFGWFEPPDPQAIAASLALLRQLGALDAGGVTPLGGRLALLPAHPRLGRLLIEGERLGWPREAARLAALLSERDPFQPPERSGAGASNRTDLLHKLDALGAFAERRGGSPSEPGLNPGAARFVLRSADQLLDSLARTAGEGPAAAKGGTPPARGGGMGRDEALLRALLAAYPDRVARRREPKGLRGLMVGGRGVRLADSGLPASADLFLCVDLDDGAGGPRSEAVVRRAAALEPEWLPAGAARSTIDLEFDGERERVVAWKRSLYLDLVLSESEAPLAATGGGGEAEALLVEAASANLERALPLEDPEVSSFRRRVRCLADWMPELRLPRLGDDDLRRLLPGLAAGRRSFAELRRAPLFAALEGTLAWEQLEAVRREAPERLTVPSGSLIRLQYPDERGRPPVLAARIQEMFGLAETPRVAAGRVPVLLHLLAPNGRPQQVTDDLASFWAQTYQQVRKELAGRYPKHSWPLDPWNARPERRPGRRS